MVHSISGVKLTIQNEISKLDPDHDEKPRRIISEASGSKIETISTVTAAPEKKEHVHEFFSCIDNSTLRKILKKNQYSLEFLSNKLSNEDINSEVGKTIWKDLYERIEKEVAASGHGGGRTPYNPDAYDNGNDEDKYDRRDEGDVD